MGGAAEFVGQMGQGPNANLVLLPFPADPFLGDWSEWTPHDGSGLPTHVMGRRVMLSGSAHDGISLLPDLDVVVTPEYARSDVSAVWDWSRGYGGVGAYRVLLRAPVPLDRTVLLALTHARLEVDFAPLLIGMDGVAE